MTDHSHHAARPAPAAPRGVWRWSLLAVLIAAPWWAQSRRPAADRRVLRLPGAGQPVEPAGRLYRARLGRPAGLCRAGRLCAVRLRAVPRHATRCWPSRWPGWSARWSSHSGRRCWSSACRAPISPSAPGWWPRSSACRSRRSPRWAAGPASACRSTALHGARRANPAREALIYWVALALGVGLPGLVYLLAALPRRAGADRHPRQRDGLGQPWRRHLARSSSSSMWSVAGMTAMVGALIFLQKLRISPDAAFSVNDWTAFVIFIVVIGGIGTIEGPIIGTIVYLPAARVPGRSWHDLSADPGRAGHRDHAASRPRASGAIVAARYGAVAVPRRLLAITWKD